MAKVTHYPNRNGPICGAYPVPTDARDYVVDSPTCPKCSDWLTKARAASEPPPPPQRPSRSGAGADTNPPKGDK